MKNDEERAKALKAAQNLDQRDLFASSIEKRVRELERSPEQTVAAFLHLFYTDRFTQEDLFKLKTLIEQRLTSKTCWECGSIGLEAEGDWKVVSPVLGAPKQFICKKCKGKGLG